MHRRIALGLLLSTLTTSAFAAEPRNFDIQHYATTLDLDIAAGQLQGETLVSFNSTAPLQQLVLDSGELVIDSAAHNGKPVNFQQADGKLTVSLSTPLTAGEETSVRLHYHGKPRFGLEFAPARNEVYTIFSTDQWMPSINAPDERATLMLALRLP